MIFKMPNELVDTIVNSFKLWPNRWIIDGDLLINRSGIFIGNWDQPESLIVHSKGIKFGFRNGTISAAQAEKISSAASDLASEVYTNQAKEIISSM